MKISLYFKLSFVLYFLICQLLFDFVKAVRVMSNFVLTIFTWLNIFSASTLANENKIIGTAK